MKEYSVLRDKLDKKGFPTEGIVELTTNSLLEAKSFYTQLINEIEFYDQKNTGASLMKNVKNSRGDYDTETLICYVRGQNEN